MYELWQTIITFFHYDVVVNLIYVTAVPTLIILAWFFMIRFMQTSRFEYVLLVLMFAIHAVSGVAFAMHRYIHEDWIRTIYRMLFMVVLILIWIYFVRYRRVFAGKRVQIEYPL